MYLSTLPKSSRRALLGRVAGGALAGLLPACAEAAGRKPPKVILYQANLSARTAQLLANQAHVDALPFDGVTLNIPASWSVMEPGAVLSYDDVYRSWLAPLVGRFARVRRDFVLAVVRKAADPFDDWGQVIENWRVLARASRDAGLEGILFDNEAYFERLWSWPDEVDYERPLADYQAAYRARGAELMAALCREWPGIRLLVLHGPYLSEPRTPRSVTLQQADPAAEDLSGHFFVGLLQGSDRPGQVIDGGEVYQYRTTEDFNRSYAWRKRSLASLTPGGLIPKSLRPAWPKRLSVGFGVYDLQWKPGYPMTPPILRDTLARAMRRADDYVWLFTEGSGPHDYLVPGGVAPDWIEAVRAAKAAGGRSSRNG